MRSGNRIDPVISIAKHYNSLSNEQNRSELDSQSLKTLSRTDCNRKAYLEFFCVFNSNEGQNK